MVTFRVDILCINHSQPSLVGRRYCRGMDEVIATFEEFVPRSREHCPYHNDNSLIPKFGGISPDVEIVKS